MIVQGCCARNKEPASRCTVFGYCLGAIVLLAVAVIAGSFFAASGTGVSEALAGLADTLVEQVGSDLQMDRNTCGAVQTPYRKAETYWHVGLSFSLNLDSGGHICERPDGHHPNHHASYTCGLKRGYIRAGGSIGRYRNHTK